MTMRRTSGSTSRVMLVKAAGNAARPVGGGAAGFGSGVATRGACCIAARGGCGVVAARGAGAVVVVVVVVVARASWSRLVCAETFGVSELAGNRDVSVENNFNASVRSAASPNSQKASA